MYSWMIYIEKQDIQASNKSLPKRQIPIDDEEDEEDK